MYQCYILEHETGPLLKLRVIWKRLRMCPAGERKADPHSTLGLVLFEDLFEGAHGALLHVGKHVRIGVEGDGYGGVP